VIGMRPVIGHEPTHPSVKCHTRIVARCGTRAILKYGVTGADRVVDHPIRMCSP
jgi:hypothetical protein